MKHQAQAIGLAPLIVDPELLVHPAFGEHCLAVLDVATRVDIRIECVGKQDVQRVMILVPRFVPLNRRPVEDGQLSSLWRCRWRQVSCGGEVGEEREEEGHRSGGDALPAGQHDVPPVSGYPPDRQVVASTGAVDGIRIFGYQVDHETLVALEVESVQLSPHHGPLYCVQHNSRTVLAQIDAGFHEPDLSGAGLADRREDR